MPESAMGNPILPRRPEHTPTHPPALAVIGVEGDNLAGLPREALDLLASAGSIAGGTRLLALVEGAAAAGILPRPKRLLDLTGDIDGPLASLAHTCASGEKAAVLASGDPGFFGVLRRVLACFERSKVRVIPARSSVSLAFARLSIPWDDALVISAHGRPLDAAVSSLLSASKAAILCSPDNPPQVIGRALKQGGATPDLVAVCSNLATENEEVVETDIDGLASGSFEPFSVLVVIGPGGLPLVGWRSSPPLSFGLADSSFAHRAGMVTKAEVRAIVIGKLSLPRSGVLWDIGAGSGSVAIECARMSPGLTVFAVESDPASAKRIAANARIHGVSIHIMDARAPEVLVRLPDPDRVFVGGGGIEVLRAAVKRLRPGGSAVATFASMDRAVEAGRMLGNLLEVSLSRGARLPGDSWRLAAENPVFVAWGPDDAGGAPNGEALRTDAGLLCAAEDTG